MTVIGLQGGRWHSSRDSTITIIRNFSFVPHDAWYLSYYAYPKFLLNGAGVGLRVQAVHVVVHGAELAGWYGGVATETRLQNGIVDKDVLLLQKTASSLRIYQTSRTRDNEKRAGIEQIFLFSWAAENTRLSVSLYLAERNPWPFHDLRVILLLHPEALSVTNICRCVQRLQYIYLHYFWCTAGLVVL